MTTPVPVHIATDVCEGRGLHYFAPLIPSAVIITLSHEVPTPMSWTPGNNSTHAFAKSVKHRGLPIAQLGHDCGPFIPEEVGGVSPWLNAMSVYVVPLTSRKIMCGSGKVQACKAPIGVSKGYDIPFLTCSDPLRSDTVEGTTHQVNTVLVGATKLDTELAYYAVRLARAIDTYKFLKLITSEGIELEFEVLNKLKAPFKKFNPLGFSLPDTTDVMNIVFGAVRSASISYETGWRTPVTISWASSTGSGTGLSEGYSFDPNTKTFSHTASGTVRGKTVGVSESPLGAPTVTGPQGPPPGYVDDPVKGYVKKEAT